MYALCLFFRLFLFVFFLLFLCFTSTPNDLGSFNEENDSLVARAISNLELTRNIFFNSTHKTSISTLEELFSSFEQTKKKSQPKVIHRDEISFLKFFNRIVYRVQDAMSLTNVV